MEFNTPPTMGVTTLTLTLLSFAKVKDDVVSSTLGYGYKSDDRVKGS